MSYSMHTYKASARHQRTIMSKNIVSIASRERRNQVSIK